MSARTIIEGHNTPLQNAEFQLTFTETNLRWLLGASPRDEKLIAKTRAAIAEIEAKIERLRHQPAEVEGQPVSPPPSDRRSTLARTHSPYWINQPSRLQPAHQHHGKNVFAKYGEDPATVHFADGSTEQVPRRALSSGWRSDNASEWSPP